MELEAFQPARWCHGEEQGQVLIPEFACSPASCWVFSSLLPNMQTKWTSDCTAVRPAMGH